MNTEAQILKLTQWLSPAYPLGSFAYSHGLETVIASDRVCTAEGLQEWLKDVLRAGTGRNDCILLRAAFACKTPEAAVSVDVHARAFAAGAERLEESLAQGAAFAATTSAIWGGSIPALTHPVAVGYAAGQHALPLLLTAQMYLQAFAGNLVSAAVRLVPLGQTEGQACLASLGPVCTRVAAETANLRLGDLAGSAFLSDIASMRHEILQPRIFRT